MAGWIRAGVVMFFFMRRLTVRGEAKHLAHVVAYLVSKRGKVDCDGLVG